MGLDPERGSGREEGADPHACRAKELEGQPVARPERECEDDLAEPLSGVIADTGAREREHVPIEKLRVVEHPIAAREMPEDVGVGDGREERKAGRDDREEHGRDRRSSHRGTLQPMSPMIGKTRMVPTSVGVPSHA